MSPARSIAAPILAALLFLTACASASISAIQSCRALDNAEYQLQSDNMVALGQGQYVIFLSGDKTQQNFVCTPTTLIRADAARLVVQINSHRTRITVLSGHAVIKDLQERHIIDLQPQTIYETARADANSSDSEIQLEDFADSSSMMPAFQTKKSRTSLYRVSSKQFAASKIGASLCVDEKDSHSASMPQARLVSPPTVLNYEIGARFARCMPIPPSLVQHFPPSGIIVERVDQLVAETEPPK